MQLMSPEERMEIKFLSRFSKVNVTSARNKDINHMNANLRTLAHRISMVIAIIARSLDIENLNTDLSLHGHQIR